MAYVRSGTTVSGWPLLLPIAEKRGIELGYRVKTLLTTAPTNSLMFFLFSLEPRKGVPLCDEPRALLIRDRGLSAMATIVRIA